MEGESEHFVRTREVYAKPEYQRPVSSIVLWIVRAVQVGHTSENDSNFNYKPETTTFNVLCINEAGLVQVYPVEQHGRLFSTSVDRWSPSRNTGDLVRLTGDDDLTHGFTPREEIDDLALHPFVQDWRIRILSIFREGKSRNVT